MSKSNKELAVELTIAYMASYGELTKGPNSFRLNPIEFKDAASLLKTFKATLDGFDSATEEN